MGPSTRLRRLADQVRKSDHAVAAARLHPKRLRGKKIPAMAFMPPPGSNRKARILWDRALHCAECQADQAEE